MNFSYSTAAKKIGVELSFACKATKACRSKLQKKFYRQQSVVENCHHTHTLCRFCIITYRFTQDKSWPAFEAWREALQEYLVKKQNRFGVEKDWVDVFVRARRALRRSSHLKGPKEAGHKNLQDTSRKLISEAFSEGRKRFNQVLGSVYF